MRDRSFRLDRRAGVQLLPAAKDARPREAQCELDTWAALVARHKAALEVARSGSEPDRELLLSYVVWPTEWIKAVVHEAIAPAAA